MARGVSVAVKTSTSPPLVSIRLGPSGGSASTLKSEITITKMGTIIVPTSNASTAPPKRNRSRPTA